MKIETATNAKTPAIIAALKSFETDVVNNKLVLDVSQINQIQTDKTIAKNER